MKIVLYNKCIYSGGEQKVRVYVRRYVSKYMYMYVNKK